MRIGLALAALLLALPLTAAAQDEGYGYRYDPAGDSGMSNFAGLRGSLAFTGAASTNVPTTPPTSLRASTDLGGGGSIYVGTRLPLGLRVELEGVYRYLPLNSVDLGGTRIATASGRAHLLAPMVNLFWDLPVPDFPFRPFIGGGIGGAYVAAYAADNTVNTYYRPSSWQFAYDLMGGAKIPLSQSSRFTAMYRWLQAEGPSGKCGVSGMPTYSCKSNLNTQSIDLGLEMDM